MFKQLSCIEAGNLSIFLRDLELNELFDIVSDSTFHIYFGFLSL